ncbi:polynucleotide 5'-hydroxyl-kinase NOL9 [Trichonephila clavipes]|nr:polynucleotide 5'-hydroxyl-kinase NOL9 [Trichonephila clavipes]
MKYRKLSDGKGISGRGRLTDNEISKLQQYYGLAIRRNMNSVSDMFKAVWTIYFHKLLTDSVPQHGLCPTSPDTWCGFNKAKLLGEAYLHKHSLSEPVLLAIKLIFKSLSDKKLLEKCIYGKIPMKFSITAYGNVCRKPHF